MLIYRSIRGLIFAIILVVGVTFLVGETRGILVGIVGSTEIFAYKSNDTIASSRTAFNSSEFSFGMVGKVGSGSVAVNVTYSRPRSFQDPTLARISERSIYEKIFHEGDIINLYETLHHGKGVYRVTLTFARGTGRFTVTMPVSASL